jgi:hypothetical protein
MSNTDQTETALGRLRGLVPAPLRSLLPTVQERGRYTGPFSTFAEYHALGVGFALGPQFQEVAAGYGAGSGGGKCRRSAHLSDAVKELAYAGLGVGLRYAVGVV